MSTDHRWAGSALAAAVVGRDLAAVRRLLDAGADPNEPHPANGATPLHHAAFLRDVEMLRLLLARGADPSRRTTDIAFDAHDDAWPRGISPRGALDLLLRRDEGWGRLFDASLHDEWAQHAEVLGLRLDDWRAEVTAKPATVAKHWEATLVTPSADERRLQLVLGDDGYALDWPDESAPRRGRWLYEPGELGLEMDGQLVVGTLRGRILELEHDGLRWVFEPRSDSDRG